MTACAALSSASLSVACGVLIAKKKCLWGTKDDGRYLGARLISVGINFRPGSFHIQGFQAAVITGTVHFEIVISHNFTEYQTA